MFSGGMEHSWQLLCALVLLIAALPLRAQMAVDFPLGTGFPPYPSYDRVDGASIPFGTYRLVWQ